MNCLFLGFRWPVAPILSCGIAEDASERVAKHEEFVEGPLDNIQSHRKPRLSVGGIKL